MKKYLLISFLSFFVMAISPSAFAIKEFGFSKKQKNKEKTRWTLSDWMTQKKNFKFMDVWLAMNTSANLFEFYAGGGQGDLELDDGSTLTEYDLTRGKAGFFVSIFGLEYEYEKAKNYYTSQAGQLSLRLLGTSEQATHLKAFYGVRQLEESTPAPLEVDQNYYGGHLTLYIFSFLGIEGSYKKYLDAESDTNEKIGAERVSYGGFIELSLIRLYGKFINETQERTPSGGSLAEQTWEGTEVGAQFYF